LNYLGQQKEKDISTFLSFIFLPIWCSSGFRRLVHTLFYKRSGLLLLIN
jgi:hypothetical protein